MLRPTGLPPPHDRRAATRVEVELEVDCVSDAVHLFATSRDLSPGGVFVRTLDPMPAGTALTVHLAGAELDLADPPQALTVRGVVAWANPYRPGARGDDLPGIGVRFLAVDDATRDVLTQLVRRIAWP